MATCQITHLARVNNYSETRVIALRYAYISHAARPLRRTRRPSTQSRPARETFPPLLLPFAFDFEKSGEARFFLAGHNIGD